MNYLQDKQETNKKLDLINTKLDTITNLVIEDDLIINAHPAMYLLLIGCFIISMTFISTGSIKVAKQLHPTGDMSYWGYLIGGIVFFIIAIIVGIYSGIKITKV